MELTSFWMIWMAIAVCPLAISAQTGDAGAPGAFLKLGSGVRALAMGRAFVGLADDATASYWNPAGLVQIKGEELSLMYAEPFGKVAGITHQNLAYAKETGDINFGLNFIYASVDGIEGYDKNAVSKGNFGSQEWAALLSLAYPPSTEVAWGTTFKLVSQKIKDYSARGFGSDLGLLFMGQKDIQYGLVIENLISPNLQLRDTMESYPRRVRYGLALSPNLFRRYLKTVITADLVSQEDTTPKQFYGIEGEVFKRIRLRGGYNTATFEQSCGAGLMISRLTIDYAYVLHQYLGDTHRVGLGVKF